MDIGEAPSDPTKEGEGGEEVMIFQENLTAMIHNPPTMISHPPTIIYRHDTQLTSQASHNKLEDMIKELSTALTGVKHEQEYMQVDINTRCSFITSS